MVSVDNNLFSPPDFLQGKTGIKVNGFVSSSRSITLEIIIINNMSCRVLGISRAGPVNKTYRRPAGEKPDIPDYIRGVIMPAVLCFETGHKINNFKCPLFTGETRDQNIGPRQILLGDFKTISSLNAKLSALFSI